MGEMARIWDVFNQSYLGRNTPPGRINRLVSITRQISGGTIPRNDLGGFEKTEMGHRLHLISSAITVSTFILNQLWFDCRERCTPIIRWRRAVVRTACG